MLMNAKAGNAGRWVALPFLIVYVVVVGLAERMHTMWRDETEAWIVARNTYGLRGLLHGVRYEAHPPAWYAVLHVITHFTWNVEWEKAPNFLFAVAVVTMVLTATRVKLWVRLGLVFSYFLMFEYAVIDRNYMMGVMLIVAGLLRMRRAGADVWVPLLLGVATLTSLPALIVAVMLFGLHLWLGLEDDGRIRTERWLGAAFFALCTVCALAVIRPPKDSGLMLDNLPSKGLVVKLVHPFHDVAKAYVPVPVFKVAFWESNAMDARSPLLFTGMGLLLTVALVFFFRQPNVRAFFLLSTLALLGQFAVSTRTDMRHVGWLFVTFAVALLCDEIPGVLPETNAPKSTWRECLLTALLVVQVIGGVFAVSVSMRHTFSSSKKVAEFLKSQGLADGPMVFAPDFVSLSVLAYLERPTAYSVESHSQGAIVVWDKKEHFARHTPSREELLAASTDGRMPVLVTEIGLPDEVQATLGVHQIGYFQGEISRDQYFVYR